MGVRRPVLSISMRPLIGMVQPAAKPGKLQGLVHLADEFLLRDAVGCDVAEDRFDPIGRPRRVPGVAPVATRVLGFRMITVSSMESGAGSVDVSALPALPSTYCTSGNCFIILSVTCRSFCASVMEIPGMVEGM